MRKRKGASLIELLVSVGIFAVIIMAIFAVMEIGKGAWFTGDVTIELRSEIVKAFMWMERELKETRASEVSLGSGETSSTLSFRVPQDNNGDGTVLDSTGAVEWSGNITYALNGSNEITRTDLSGNTSVIAHNIVSLQFSRPAAELNMLQVTITARKASSVGRVAQENGMITVKMRN